MTVILFYVFAAILIVSAVMVVSARNSVHAALFLVLAFCNAAGLFLMAGAEFLAIMLITIYAGAVMILFLFVVMTMNTNLVQAREGVQRYMPLGLLVAGVLVFELVMVALNYKIDPKIIDVVSQPNLKAIPNTTALGSAIYTHYILLFQISGLVLLVAMIGAIVLTLRHRPINRRQNITSQHMREPVQTLEMKSVNLNQGVEENGGFLRPKDSYYGIAEKDSFGPSPGDKMDITEKRQKGE